MSNHPVHRIVRIFVKNLDENPRVQLRIHTIGFWYWTINFPIVAWLFIFEPHLWLKWGLFVTLVYSIYANWSTDYSGMGTSETLLDTHHMTEVTVQDDDVSVKVSDD